MDDKQKRIKKFAFSVKDASVGENILLRFFGDENGDLLVWLGPGEMVKCCSVILAFVGGYS